MQTQMPTDKAKQRKPSGAEKLAQEIADLRERTKLESWTSFVEELQVPGDLLPALLTSRIELLRAAKPRALTEGECAVIYKLIGGLLETNMALREHTASVARLTENLNGQIIGFHRVAQQISDFANFRTAEPEGDDE